MGKAAKFHNCLSLQFESQKTLSLTKHQTEFQILRQSS